jgi:3-oxoacyl-[acyl-carrier-protein] synthase II
MNVQGSPSGPSSARRVVITGVGLVTPVGIGVKKNWEALLRGQSGVGPITRFDASRYTTRIAGEVKDFDPLVFIEKREARKMDRFIQFAMGAAALAVEDSRIDPGLLAGDRTGVYIGSGIGGLATIEECHSTLLQRGPDRVSPFFLISIIINEASGYVSIKYKSRGPNSATATACATSTHSIGDSFRMIARGDADRMLAGGAEAPVTPLGVAGFCAIRALSTRNDEPERASRPFDAERDGFVMGEGAGILLLEELGAARKRGARIYAEIIGYGMNADAYHVTAPDEDAEGAKGVMQRALADAGIDPSEVGLINAHGTSTPLNDKIETLAVKKVFGGHARKIGVNSTKSMTGHLLGAAGAVEAGVTAHPDPDCDLDYVPNTARPAEIRCALSNSFGFGGTNGCLVFKRYEDNV